MTLAERASSFTRSSLTSPIRETRVTESIRTLCDPRSTVCRPGVGVSEFVPLGRRENSSRLVEPDGLGALSPARRAASPP